MGDMVKPMNRYSRPLGEHYNAGWRFFKPAVLRASWNGMTPQWVTLGAGHQHLGCAHDTFEEAIEEALNGHRPVHTLN